MGEKKYIIRDTAPQFRHKMNDILDTAMRGQDACLRVFEDDRNSPDIRNYHKGKAEAFREIIALFDRYKKE